MKTKVFAVCAVIFLFCGVAHADLKDGLVAHWSFDDCEATDNSGNKRNGSIEGSPQCIDGISGKAFYFNGINDLIRVSNTFPTVIPNTSPVAVSAWIKTATTKDAAGIVTQHTACGGSNGGLDDHFHITLYGPNSNSLQADAFDSTRVSVERAMVSDNKWHHIVLVYDGTTNYLYIDGVQKNTVSASPQSIFDPTVDVAIGGFHTNSCYVSHNFEGAIDEVRLYNRAISASEVQQLYQGQVTCSNSIVTFTAGTPAKAADVNANFDALNCQIQALKAIVCKNEPTASVCQ